MDDDLLDVTDEERAAAEALSRALEKPSEAPAGSDAAFVLALRATKTAPKLDAGVEERAIEAAIASSRKARRARIWRPMLLAAAVLLVVVPAATQLNGWLTPPRVEAEEVVVFDAPFDEAQRASERADRLSRARTRSYFDARLRGAR